MHIAFINTLYPPHGPLGGAEATLRFLVQSLGARGHTCTVVTLSPDSEPRRGEVDGATVHYLPLANVYWPHGPRPRALRPAFQVLDAYNPVMRARLQRCLDASRPDVVHAHNLQGFSISAWDAARVSHVPLVQTLHDYYVACPRSTMWRPDRGNCQQSCVECRWFSLPRRRRAGLPAVVTAVSNRMLARIRAAGLFRDTPARIIRGNNAPSHPASVLQVGSGTLHLGFLGRLDPVKGVEQAIDAVASLPPGTVRLSIAGRGTEPYEAALRQRAGSAPVAFLGQVDPASFLPQLDLLLIPSVWEDPFPRVCHEALAYGVPSLVAPLGGLPECVTDGVTGFVAPSPDVAGLRSVLDRLIRSGWSGHVMRAACLQAARAYEPDRITGQYEAVLDAAARRQPPPDWAGEPA